VANTATGIVLIAGTATFANEWYQTKKVNWKVPIATLLLGAVIDGLNKVDDKAAIGLAIMVAIAASATKFGGKSIIDTMVQLWGTKQPGKVQPIKTNTSIPRPAAR